MPQDLEDRIKRSLRRRRNVIENRTVISSHSKRNHSLPAMLRKTYNTAEKRVGWNRLCSPRPHQVLYVTGVPEFHDVEPETRYWSYFSSFVARLPPQAQELLVDYGVLKIKNPSSHRAFGIQKWGVRKQVYWDYDKGRYSVRTIPVTQHYYPSRLDVADGIMNAEKIHLSDEQCRELYEACKDDERALLLLQQRGIIDGTIEQRTLTPAAILFGSDGEDIPYAYQATYNHRGNRTFAVETVLPKREMQRKKREFA